MFVAVVGVCGYRCPPCVHVLFVLWVLAVVCFVFGVVEAPIGRAVKDVRLANEVASESAD